MRKYDWVVLSYPDDLNTFDKHSFTLQTPCDNQRPATTQMTKALAPDLVYPKAIIVDVNLTLYTIID
jgi:hypothetical protein